MKIVTASNGKKTVKMSKVEWQQIGKTAGWEDGNHKSWTNPSSIPDEHKNIHDEAKTHNIKPLYYGEGAQAWVVIARTNGSILSHGRARGICGERFPDGVWDFRWEIESDISSRLHDGMKFGVKASFNSTEICEGDIKREGGYNTALAICQGTDKNIFEQIYATNPLVLWIVDQEKQ